MKVKKLNRGRIEFNLRHDRQRIRQVVPIAELVEWLLARQDRILECDLQLRMGSKGSISLRSFAERHYPTYAEYHQPKSWKKGQRRVRCLTSLLGDRNVHEISERDYESILRYGRGKGLQPASINHLALRLSNILRAAREAGYIRRGSALPSKPGFKLSNERDRVLSDLEVNLLMAHAKHPAMKTVLVVALNTGMRRSELANLRWSELDLLGGWIQVRETKNGRPRQVPINSRVCRAFENSVIPMHDDRVFGVKADWISHEFAKVAKAAGVTGACFHDTRRTFMWRALQSGMPEDLVRRIVGHRTHMMISRYAVFGGEYMSEMMEKAATGRKCGHKSGHTQRAGVQQTKAANRLNA